LNTTGLDDQN